MYDGWNILDLSLFAFTQGTIFQFWTPDSLRGFGCGVPNGALWTIGVIIQFYLIAPIIQKKLSGRNNVIWFLFILTIILVEFLLGAFFSKTPESIISKLYSVSVIPYLWMFLLGGLISEFWDRIKSFVLKYWYVFLLLSLFLEFLNFDIKPRGDEYPMLKFAFRFIGLLGMAYKFPSLNIRTDISYAMYIYHMIVINVLLELGFVQSKGYYGLFITIGLTLLLAYISTTTIGKWASSKKVLAT